ncbi:unnamed protein product [Paramecium sonneborni]|uniref:Transmembrane protein n=1 Tax=Paramecium sonneborni TaxID=65129 RepID=A0A8S1P0H5_9CILI|nr:unnamed protein product [Paramecium sonneborni]
MLQEIEKKNLINIVTHILEQERREKIKFIEINYRSIIKEQLKFISKNLSKNAVNKCKYLQFLYFLNVIIILLICGYGIKTEKFLMKTTIINLFRIKIKVQQKILILPMTVIVKKHSDINILHYSNISGQEQFMVVIVQKIQQFMKLIKWMKIHFLKSFFSLRECVNKLKLKIIVNQYKTLILEYQANQMIIQIFSMKQQIKFKFSCMVQKKLENLRKQNDILPFNVTCPITKIGFLQNLDDHDIFRIQKNNSSYSIIKVNQEFYFYSIINSSDRLPISQVQLTESDKVCLLNSLNNIQKVRNEFYLMKVRRQNCEKTDTAFKNEFNISEEQLYLANNLRNLKHNLPFFQSLNIELDFIDKKLYINQS